MVLIRAEPVIHRLDVNSKTIKEYVTAGPKQSWSFCYYFFLKICIEVISNSRLFFNSKDLF